jgi:hypothetical protein
LVQRRPNGVENVPAGIEIEGRDDGFDPNRKVAGTDDGNLTCHIGRSAGG